MTLSEATRAKIALLKSRYPERKSAVGPSLYLLQAEKGWCTPEGMGEIAELLDLNPADVLATASFYTMFYKEPVGRKAVDVCTNLACMINGSDALLEHISQKLNTPVNGVSPDGRCVLHHVECLGYCDRAPMLQIDFRPFGPLTFEDADKLLAAENLLPDSAPVENGVEESALDLSGLSHLTDRQPGANGAGRGAAS